MNRKVAVFLSLCMGVGLLSSGVYADNISTENYLYISGSNRYKTSAEVSRKSYSSTVDNVVIASGESFPDALAGGPFAYSKKAPIMLVSKSGVSSEVTKELERLKPSNIYILGGKGTISDSVEKSLAKYAKNVKRISGSNRYTTSVEIAKEIKKDFKDTKETVIVSGKNFADSLSAGALAAKLKAPIILTDGKTLPSGWDVIIKDKDNKNIVVGGNNSVNVSGIKYTRISGSDRYATSVKVAADYFKNSDTMALVSGENYPDGLSAMSLYNKYTMPIILTKSTILSGNLVSYIRDNKTKNLIVVGGNSSVSSFVRTRVRDEVSKNKFELKKPDIVDRLSEGDKVVRVRLNEKTQNAGKVLVYKLTSSGDVKDTAIGKIEYAKGEKDGKEFNVSLDTELKKGERVVARIIEGEKMSDYSSVSEVKAVENTSRAQFNRVNSKTINIETSKKDSSKSAVVIDKLEKYIKDNISIPSKYSYSFTVTDSANIEVKDGKEYRKPKVKMEIKNKEKEADHYSSELDNIIINIVSNSVTGVKFDDTRVVAYKGDTDGIKIYAKPVISGDVSDSRKEIRFELSGSYAKNTKIESKKSGSKYYGLLKVDKEEKAKEITVKAYSRYYDSEYSVISVPVKDKTIKGMKVELEENKSGQSISDSSNETGLKLEGKGSYSLSVSLKGKDDLESGDNISYSVENYTYPAGSEEKAVNVDIKKLSTKFVVSVTDESKFDHNYNLVLKYKNGEDEFTKIVRVEYIKK